jgi:1,4-alpha-glucan branching enzyme
MHRGVQALVRDLNWLYRKTPALHQLDMEHEGFAWVDASNWEESIIAFLRKGRAPDELALVVCNFTPVPREGYRIGVPRPGRWRERVNSDAADYGGSGVGNAGEVHAHDHPMHGHPHSLDLRLPPLATMIFTYEP